MGTHVFVSMLGIVLAVFTLSHFDKRATFHNRTRKARRGTYKENS